MSWCVIWIPLLQDWKTHSPRCRELVATNLSSVPLQDLSLAKENHLTEDYTSFQWLMQGYKVPVPFLQCKTTVKAHPSSKLPVRLASETFVATASQFSSFLCLTLLPLLHHRNWSQEHLAINFLQANFSLRDYFPGNLTNHTFISQNS